MRSAHIGFVAPFLIISLACGGSGDPPIDASATQPDAFTPALCGAHGDCDNGRFCDGFELCVPGDAMADVRGCVPGQPPCGPTQVCDESAGRCLSDCDTNPDADGDGDPAINCNGFDCDDNDPEVHSGAVEVCDAEGRDEDCNPNTLAGPAETDLDDDGYVSNMCCNIQETGALRCGLDCDDNNSAVHPAHPEVCDGIDNDCDGLIDENVRATFYRDADGDLYGDPNDSVEACVQPPGYVANADDCDDTSNAIHPGAAETCNDLDDDCDGSTDEDVTPAPATAEHCGGCNLACPTGFTCDGTTCVDGAAEVAAGHDVLCARTQSGAVYCWGFDDWGPTPTSISGLSARMISVGAGQACAVTESGEVACWGHDPISGTFRSSPDTFTVPGGVISVSVGDTHACALSTSGVYCWGRNSHGQLGDGTTFDRSAPVRVSFEGAEEITTGQAHSCARRGPAVFCWGNNARGQLGEGTTSSSLVPTQVSVTEASAIAAASDTTCAGQTDGASCWGANETGQTGQPATNIAQPSPAAVDLLSGAVHRVALAGLLCDLGPTLPPAPRAHACSLRSTGRISCWGSNAFGALGDDTAVSRHYALQVAGITSAIDIASGSLHESPVCGTFSCAVTSPGDVLCWGANVNGFLQTGSILPALTVPTAVVGFPVTAAPTPTP